MSHSLRIAMFVDAFPTASETFILRQITGLIDLGHDVHIYANVRGDNHVVHDSITHYRLLDRTTYVDGPAEAVVFEMPVSPLSGRTWPPGSEHSVRNMSRLTRALPTIVRCATAAPRITKTLFDTAEYSYRAESLSGMYRLAALLRTGERYDVLHAHFGPVGNSFRFARDLFEVPLVVSFHGYDFSTVPRKEGADVYKRLFAMADVITANSEYTKRQLEALGCSVEKIALLPVGLNPDAFAFRARYLAPNEPIRILTVARLVEIKGHEYAIRAVARLRETCPALRYDIVGDGPLRKRLEALVAELQLGDVVHLHGAKSETEVRQFFCEAHIFVLGSVTVDGDQEGQGLVLQEAQACGLPVVATRHGAFPEGISTENAYWLVPERDPEAMAAKLATLIESHGQWAILGSAGRSFVEKRYDIRSLNQQLVAIYRTAIEQFQQ